MLRLAALLSLALAGAALAQTAEPPPVVATEAPELADPAVTESPAPTLPTIDPPPLPGPDGDGLPAASGSADDPASAPVSVSAPPVDTELLTLVVKAHPVVQAVMALLVAAVFAVLTIFLFKLVEFSLAFARLSRERRALAATPALAMDGHKAKVGPLARALVAARTEMQDLPPRLSADLRASARERLDLSLARIEADAVRRLRSGTGLLATIGSVAPFVGLFGTVFGIMNSFIAIAATQTTNLAVVAPGIAEALLATGIGLAAAIPAVMLYNRAMRRIAEFRHHLADGIAEVLRRFSREMDARMAQGA